MMRWSVGVFWAVAAFAQPVTWRNAMRQPEAWYGSAEAVRIADNLLAYQLPPGGWDKNIDMSAAPAADRGPGQPTIDNDATYTQMRYLARVHRATGHARFAAAFRRGFEYLREHGVAVDVGLAADRARALNRPFFTRMREGRPFVMLKAATSLDGCIAEAPGRRTQLTSAEADRHAHAVRAEIDAIGVGINTLLVDDPLLTPPRRVKKACRIPVSGSRTSSLIIIRTRNSQSRLAAILEKPARPP